MKKLPLFLLLLMAVLPLSNAYFHHDSEIEWHEFNQDAFDMAKKEDKPVFMLITAIWCYWCHVYEEETLENEGIAEYINQNFIPVFVDADKRQDLTRQYLAGGWPSTVLFSPDGREISRINGHIKKQDLMNYLGKVNRFFETSELPKDYKKQELVLRNYKIIAGKTELIQLSQSVPSIISQNYDEEYGGYGGGQKFPTAIAWDYLLSEYEKTGNEEFLNLVTNTLDNIYNENYIDDWNKPLDLGEFNGLRRFDDERVFQGIYDPVEGGFFRYATRRDWSIPHYEKMLDVNANLARLYLHAYKITKNEKYREIAENTLKYIEKNLYDKENGGFYGSQDAGKEIYYRQKPEIRLSGKTKEPRPRIDKTKYSDFNAPAIIAFFYASEILNDDTYKNMAIKTSDFFYDNMLTNEGILHYDDGEKAELNGLLLDNAYMSLAFSIAYNYTLDEKYKKASLKLIDFSMERLFEPSQGAFIERHSSDKHLYAQGQYILRDVPYSGNSVMALALKDAFELTGDTTYLESSNTVIGYFIQTLGELDNAAMQSIAAESIINNLELKETAEIIETGEKVQISTGINLSIMLFLIAFIVGVLSFLSPCTLPILPAYFAYMFKSERKKMILTTFSFFLGLAVVFSIIGMASTLIGSFLRYNSFAISGYLGVFIIAFGIITIFGIGFSGLKIAKRPTNTLIGPLFFGMAFAIGWTPCVGPILASLFIVASQSATAVSGGLLLFTYSLGLSLPLILISLFFDKLGPTTKVWKFLKGSEFTICIFRRKLSFHTTSLISGILLILTGLLMSFGYLYIFSQYVTTTGFQKWIFGLEDKLMRLF
jgi:uncharacterized protein